VPPATERWAGRHLTFRDSDLEIRMIEEAQQRVDAANARIAHYDDAALVQLAQDFEFWGMAYPTMDPVVAYEAATAGIPFDSELGVEIARESTAFVEEQRQASLPYIGTKVLVGSGEAQFADNGQFIGYSELDDTENDFIVRFIASQEQGPDGEVYRAAIENGTFNAADLLRDTNALYAPYNELIAKVDPGARGYDRFVENVYLMPNTTVAELNNEFREGVQFNSSMVMRRVRELHDDNEDWRGANIRLTEEERESVEAIDARIQAAREERQDEGSEGFGIGKAVLDMIVKPATRTIVAGAISPGQYFLNQTRSAISQARTGFTAMPGQAAFGDPSGNFLQDTPTIANPSGLTPEASAAFNAIAGTGLATSEAVRFGSMFLPVGRAVGVGRGGAMALRGAIAGVPEVVEATAFNTPTGRQRQSAAATDLGVFLDDPDLAGDGWLLGSDLIEERKRREAEFTPTFANGDYFTWGRAVARGVGLDLDTKPYNALSGTVDAFAAFRGPGEVVPDAAVEFGLGARALPGVRRVPFIGRSDPLLNAGGIMIGSRPAILRPSTEEWLSSWRGRLVAQKFAEIDNVYDVMSAANNKMDLFTAKNLAAATDPDQVMVILRASMGIGLQQTPRLSARGSLKGVSRPMDWSNPVSRFASRMLSDVPQTDPVSLADGTAIYKWADDFMRNASVSVGTRKAMLNRLADVPVRARFDVMMDIESLIAKRTLNRLTQRRLSGLFVASSTGELVGKLAARSADKAGEALSQATTSKYSDLVKARVENESIKLVDELTTFIKRNVGQQVRYNVDRAGNTAFNPLAREAAQPTKAYQASEVVQFPHLETELLRRDIPLPGMRDIRELRRINKPLYTLMANIPLYREIDKFVMPLPKVLLEAMTTTLFKPLAILRPAYVMRVVTEEQFRIAAAGGDSFTNNPTGWLAWVFGRKSGRDLDLNMKSLYDSPEGARVRIERSEESRILSTTYVIAEKGDDLFMRGWAGEIAQLSDSPLSRFVAANPMRPIKQGIGAQPIQRFEYDDAQLDFLLDEFDDVWRGFAESADDTSLFRQKWDAGDQRGAVSDYMESVEIRIRNKVAGSPELRQAVATGKLDLGNGSTVTLRGSGNSALQANTDFVRALDDSRYLQYAPDKVKAQILEMDNSVRAINESVGRSILDAVSAAIIQKPTTWWSRSPVFRQNYWNGVAENGQYLSREAASKIAKRFENVDVPAPIRRAVDRAIEQADGTMKLKDFDLLMKTQAMDKTNDLLFSLATRQQWQDAARIVAPFAAAWQEVITTWGKLLADDPFKLGRLEQADRVLGDPDFAAVLDRFPGFDTIDGQGLIYTDDYGEKKIIVPFAGIYRSLAGKLGASTPDLPNTHGDSIRLDSLNVGAGFLPGLGPAASFGASELLNVARDFGGVDLRSQDTPFGPLEDVIFPFGEVDVKILNPDTYKNLVMPSWMRYTFASLRGDDLTQMGAQDEDAYNGRVIAAMQWLLMNDPQKYDLGILEKRQLLMSDARRQVREDAYVSALSAFFGPGPVRRESFILDDDGNVQVNIDGTNDSTFMTYLSTASLYRSFLDEAIEMGLPFEDAEATAWARTTELSGTEGFISKGKTGNRLLGSVPVTREAYEWLTDNPDVRSYAGKTWQFFAPYVPNGEFFMPMYLETIEQGDRVRLTPEEWLEFAQDITAGMLYEHRVRTLGPLSDYDEDAYRQELRDYAEILEKAYPAWRNTDQQGKAASPTQVQNELDRLVSPGGEFEDHPIADAVREALTLRQESKEQAEALGYTDFLAPKGAAWIRASYDFKLTQLQINYPQAYLVIERAFRTEIRSKMFEDELGLEE
jgi:hypothetical protein